MATRKKAIVDEQESLESLFEGLKKDLSKIDPVTFAENYLTIDGKPFNLSSAGWRFLADVYRNVAIQAENPDSKPIVILKSRQIGATVMAAVLSLYFTASGLYSNNPGKPPIRILHLFPTIPLMHKYTKDKLEPMMRQSQNNYIANMALKAEQIGYIQEDTLTEKVFKGFSKLRIDAIGKDADRIRGLTQDGIFFDEIQDMGQAAIENALRILTMAQYGKKTKGIQCFFGTPKESGSYFWQLWNSSDQRFYQLRCISCDQYFFLYKYGSDEWKKIWIHGFTVKCPFCACEQDKRIAVDRGRWEPTTSSSEYQGYHINMLLSPLFTREVIDDYDPDKNQNRSIRAWKNESIGEFYSSGGMPLTFDDIVRTSLDTTRGVSRGVSEINDKIYTLGIDWGGKDLNSEFQGGQSYTAMVVLSAAPNGLFTIENAFRLKENSLTHRIKVVEELYDRYKIHTGAADFAYGNDVVNHLQIERDYRTKLLACINSGTLAKTLTYDPKSIRVTLNKNMMIEEIFSMIRQGKIRFPVRGTSWDQLLWLMKHCTSMEVKQVIRGDNYMKQYAKGSGPNDGLMAIMYAIVAYKFIATNGFAHRKEQHSGTGIPMPVLAYMPGLK